MLTAPRRKDRASNPLSDVRDAANNLVAWRLSRHFAFQSEQKVPALNFKGRLSSSRYPSAGFSVCVSVKLIEKRRHRERAIASHSVKANRQILAPIHCEVKVKASCNHGLVPIVHLHD
jgi:hypothetical protein